MSSVAGTSPFGRLINHNTLRIERLLPGPIERIWNYLSKSELRETWLAAGEMALETGAAVELVWRNDELTVPPGTRPVDISEENRMKVTVLEIEHLRKLTITWGTQGSIVTFELQPQNDDVLLTITHRNIPDRSSLLNVAPGWHAHLDVLGSNISGLEAKPFWDNFTGLMAVYGNRFDERQL